MILLKLPGLPKFAESAESLHSRSLKFYRNQLKPTTIDVFVDTDAESSLGHEIG